MYLRHLELKNFRRFGSISVDFDPNMTVIAAINGEGKTTLLEAIAIALGPFVGAFPKGRARQIISTDARRKGDGANATYPVEVKAQISNPDLTWERALRTPKGKTTVGSSRDLADYAQALHRKTDLHDAQLLPLIAWYSSRRLWINHRDTATKRPSRIDERSAGYEDCLSDASSFTQMSRWIERSTGQVLQNKDEKRDLAETDLLESRLLAIRDAVNAAVAPMEFRGFRYSLGLKSLALTHSDHGEMSLGLLSDGIRAVVSLVADMAFRATLLNPYLGANVCRDISGIVLIDEIDLHLHPKWQQQIIHSLRTIFPNIQFIISTHSPQVLATVPRSQVRVIRRIQSEEVSDSEGCWEAVKPSESSFARDSSHVLANIMDVSPSPQIVDVSEQVAQFGHLVRNGHEKSKEAEDLRATLEQKGYEFNENELRIWRAIGQRTARPNG